MKAKITKYGFKIWAICDSVSGFIKQMDVYVGKRPGEAAAKNLMQQVVLGMAKVVPVGSCIFADRYFSSMALAYKLKQRGYNYVGTIRSHGNYPNDVLFLEGPEEKTRGFHKVNHTHSNYYFMTIIYIICM